MPPIQITGPVRIPGRTEKDAEQVRPSSMNSNNNNHNHNQIGHNNSQPGSNRTNDGTLNHVREGNGLLTLPLRERELTESAHVQLLNFTLPARQHLPRAARRSGRNAPSWGRSTRERECI